jgi:hypothetical protein
MWLVWSYFADGHPRTQHNLSSISLMLPGVYLEDLDLYMTFNFIDIGK